MDGPLVWQLLRVDAHVSWENMCVTNAPGPGLATLGRSPKTPKMPCLVRKEPSAPTCKVRCQISETWTTPLGSSTR